MKNIIINTKFQISSSKLQLFILSSFFLLLTSCGEKKTEEADHEEEKSETEVALTAVQFKTLVSKQVLSK
jgi:cobalt-zinc-cadmium efflux system membrane fusion protein